jgi:hypothetical protein
MQGNNHSYQAFLRAASSASLLGVAFVMGTSLDNGHVRLL